MKAVKRFKDLLFSKRPELMQGIFGRSSRLVAPPDGIRPTSGHDRRKFRSTEEHDRKPLGRALAAEGIHHSVDVSDELKTAPSRTEKINAGPSGPAEASARNFGQKEDSKTGSRSTTSERTHVPGKVDHTKGQAHDPLTDVLFLDIGACSEDANPESGTGHVVSESPGAVDINVYEAAYEAEMQKILVRRGKTPTIYLTRRVEHNRAFREHESIISGDRVPHASGLAGLVQRAKENADKDLGEEQEVSDRS